MRLIKDQQNLNQKIVRNPYPLPGIGDTMQKPQGFQYVTVLELNMGYYIIDILPKSCNLTTIVTEFGKFRYNRVPMGMCTSGNIFQARVDELLSDIQGVKTYINDILILGKWVLSQHIYKLRVVFYRLCAARI